MKPQSIYNLKDVVVSNRKWLTFLVETLDFLANRFDREDKYIQISFLVFKMVTFIHKALALSSPYWETLRVENKMPEWDSVLKN